MRFWTINPIKAVYGSSFDSSRYLNRFFDQTYEFTVPNYEIFAKYLFDRYHINEIAPFLYSPLKLTHLKTGDINIELFALNAKIFELTLRDQEQIISQFYTICLFWDNPQKPLHSVVLIFLLMLRHVSKEDFESLQNFNFDLSKLNETPWFNFTQQRFILQTSAQQSLQRGLKPNGTKTYVKRNKARFNV
ncbi:MAG: hypothetical protein GY710_10785 [Desulfobacteraceae bacterium]|nr:hypothetical protein [Desulfobacteraceae bacterium]